MPAGPVYDYSVKFVLLGNVGVGKTTLVQQYAAHLKNKSSTTSAHDTELSSPPAKTLGLRIVKCIEPQLAFRRPVTAASGANNNNSQSSAASSQGKESATGSSSAVETVRVRLCLWDTPGGGEAAEGGDDPPTPYTPFEDLVSANHTLANTNNTLADYCDARTNSYFFSSSFCFRNPGYCRGAAVVVLVVCLQRRRSFLDLGEWVEAAKTFSGPGTLFAVVANNNLALSPPPPLPQLGYGREGGEGAGVGVGDGESDGVGEEEVQRFALRHHFFFFSCNALTGEGVCEIFSGLARRVAEEVAAGLRDPKDVQSGVTLPADEDDGEEEAEKKTSCCCCC